MRSPQWTSSINSSLSKERNTWKNETNETCQRSVHVPFSVGRPWAGNPPIRNRRRPGEPGRNRPHASNSPCQTFSCSASTTRLPCWRSSGRIGPTSRRRCRIAQKAAGQGLATAAVRKVLEHNGFVAGGSLTLNGKPAMSYICELR
jgi:hypothetical protein